MNFLFQPMNFRRKHIYFPLCCNRLLQNNLKLLHSIGLILILSLESIIGNLPIFLSLCFQILNHLVCTNFIISLSSLIYQSLFGVHKCLFALFIIVLLLTQSVKKVKIKKSNYLSKSLASTSCSFLSYEVASRSS